MENDMSNETVRLRTLETEKAIPKKKLYLPVAGIVVFGFLLFWMGTHIAGGCTDTLQDVFSFCPLK
jgi:hypothetical protein